MFVEMIFSYKDKILIYSLYQFKGYKAMELTNDFQTNAGQKVALTSCWKKIKRYRHSQQTHR